MTLLHLHVKEVRRWLLMNLYYDHITELQHASFEKMIEFLWDESEPFDHKCEITDLDAIQLLQLMQKVEAMVITDTSIDHILQSNSIFEECMQQFSNI